MGSAYRIGMTAVLAAGFAGCLEPAAPVAGHPETSGPATGMEDESGTMDSGYLDGTTKIHFLRKRDRLEWMGDIWLDPARVAPRPVPAKRAGTGRWFWSARWPHGKIPYLVDPSTPNQATLASAMADMQARTNIRFIPRTTEAEYVSVIPGSGCATSTVGRVPGANITLYVGPNCGFENLLHELGHVTGMYHEMGRADRDNYVRIYEERMDHPSCPSQYWRYTEMGMDGVDVGPFDYGSIMMYASFNCTRDFAYPAMTRLDGTTFYGGMKLSPWDIAAIRYSHSLKYSSRRRDFTGDGLNDLIWFNWKTNEASLARARTGSQTFVSIGKWISANSFHNLRAGEYRVGRFDSDNIADLLFISQSGEIRVKRNLGSSFGTAVTWLASYKLSSLDAHGTYYIGDFNGDGRDDIGCIYSSLEGGMDNAFKVAFSTGSGFQDPVTFQGRDEMGSVEAGEYQVGYFNLDNKADLMWIDVDGNAYVRLSNGSGLDPFKVWKLGGSNGNLKDGGQFLVGDLTCDGRDDLLFLNPVDNSAWMAPATANNSFGSRSTWIPAGTFGNRAQGEYMLGMHSEALPDGRKCADLLFFDESGLVTGKKSTGTGFGATTTYVTAGAFGRLRDGAHYQ